MRLPLNQIAFVLYANLSRPEFGQLEINNVCIDSRKVAAGDLFFCIPGAQFDGHDYARSVALAGAAAVVAEADKIPETELPGPDGKPVPVLHVPAAIPALGRLARHWREQSQAKVVAVTGSAGKTTVKELLSNVLRQVGDVACNPMNFNNQIGLPMSMLSATGKEKFWVMEVGISQPEDMADLGEILHPDIALVINVGPAHLSGLGDKGVAHYKAQLLRFLSPGGKCMVNADYPDLVNEARRNCSDLILFTAQGREVPYSGGYMGQDPDDGLGCYRLRFEDKLLQVKAPLLGEVGAENVIAVAAVAHSLDPDSEQIAAGLASAKLPAQRFSRSKAGAWTVVDDSYNANPLSCERTLSAVAELSAGMPLVLVMGEMGELGEAAGEYHRELGRQMAEAQIRDGLSLEDWPGEVIPLSTPETFKEQFRALDLRKGVILFKGSRVNKLETMVEVFKQDLTGEQ